MNIPVGYSERFAQRLLSVDWSAVVLQTCARRGIRMTTLAGRVSSNAQHIGRLARGEVREPNSFKLAFRLLDEYQDAQQDAQRRSA